MADRIAVMNAGRVEQFDAPEAIYDRPASLFVARFVGTANLLAGRLRREDGGHEVQLDAGGRLWLPQALPCSREGAVCLSVRPEHLSLGAPGDGAVPARVEMVLPLGPSLVYELLLADRTPVKVTQPRHEGGERFAPGQPVGLRLRAGAPAAVFLPDPVAA